MTPAPSGGSTPVWRVVVDAGSSEDDGCGETYYLRLAEEPGERRDGEVRVKQLLHSAGVRVPEVVAWEGQPPELDRAATLTRSVPGLPLKAMARTIPADDVAAIAREAGRDLAMLAATPVAGFGWIALPDATTGALRADHPTRSAWTAGYDAALDEVITAGLVASGRVPALRAAYAGWRDRAGSPSASTAWLAHGDFDATHIFCLAGSVAGSPARYTGIIDFGEARGADPGYDLGHALLHDGEDGAPPIVPALLDGYREGAGPLAPIIERDAVRMQAIAIGVRHLAIAHRRASPYATFLAHRIDHLLAAPRR
ncbi:MAG: phosphotransferase family protein [Thermomicrobiales bacterium]